MKQMTHNPTTEREPQLAPQYIFFVQADLGVLQARLQTLAMSQILQ